jgi:aspartate aminotransferase
MGGSPEFCRRLLEQTGVAVLPGRDFGQPEEEFTVRIAYVNFDGAKALTAAKRIPEDQLLNDAFLNRYCKEPIMAMKRLSNWLNSL